MNTQYNQFSESINNCFHEITTHMNHNAASTSVYDYYIHQLYTDDGSIDYSKWNQNTLNEMKEDIASLSSIVRTKF